MTSARPTVFVVEDDPSFRRSLCRLLEAHDLQVEAFPDAESFLNRCAACGPGCLILDVDLPGLSGLDLHARLLEICPDLPVIFLTGHGDIPMSVKAMRHGAIDFLAKPVRAQVLTAAVEQAFAANQEWRRDRQDLQTLQQRYALLTPREREVLALVTAGFLNKQVAFELGISERTVKAHRGQVMQKMQAESLADLIRAAQRLHITADRS
jgi:FixJ family two-component response regulator